ncbi:MAG: TolC family protein [Campylobacterales bacterium]|nr:TolC family protein [Campylobacterales bacterium]
MKKLVIYGLVATSLFSLTLDEAVERGLSNSSQVKNAYTSVSISDADISIANSKFLPSLTGTYSSSTRDKELVGQDKTTTVMSASASINLFNGFSDYFSRESAKDSYKVAQYQKEATVADFKLKIQKDYINHLNAKMEEKNQKASLDLLKEQFKTASLQFEQGIISRDDYLKVEVDMLNVEKGLLRSQNSVRTSWLTLKRTLGGVLDPKEKLVEPSAEDLKEYTFDIAKEKMYERRSELQALIYQKSSLLNQKKSLNGGYLPSVSLEMRKNFYDKELTNGGVVTRPKEETLTSVNVSWNIFSGGQTFKNSQKMKYNALIVDENIRDLKLNLDYQLASAFANYNLAKKSLVVAKKAKVSASKSFQSVKDKFDEGVANSTQFLDAREDLTKAVSDLNSARYNLLLTNAELKRVVGE